MVFDPSTIKNRAYTPQTLPEGASREQKIAALANVLLERGLATNLAAAKRLAEGMVDTERKILGQSKSEPDYARERGAFQRADSELFKAVGGVPQFAFSPGLSDFIERARKKVAVSHRLAREPVRETPLREVVRQQESPAQGKTAGQVFFADSATSTTMRPFEPVVERVPEQKHTPRSEPLPDEYVKTQVEASSDGVVVRHVEARAHQDVVIEEGIVAVPDTPVRQPVREPVAERVPEPAKPKEDLAKQQGVDLFDLFNANKK